MSKIGFAVLEQRPGSFNLLEYGLIKTLSTQTLYQRIALINEKIKAIVNTHLPEVAIIERVFISQNYHSSLQLAEARGAIISTLINQNLHCLECSALQMKKSITGRGRATKTLVAQAVTKIVQLPSDLNLAHDITDAIACAILAPTLISKQNIDSDLRINFRRGRKRR